MEESRVSYECLLRRAFELYRDHFIPLLLAHMAFLGISLFSLGILAGPLALGLARLTLDLLDGRRPPPQPGDVFEGLRYFVPALLLGLTVGAAAALCVGILRALRLGPLALLGAVPPLTAAVFAPYLMLEQGEDFLSALKRSWEMTRLSFWPLAGLVGLLLFRVGIAMTLPLYTCLTAVLWRRMAGARP